MTPETWESAKAMIIRGMPMKEVAKKTGASWSAIRKRAQLEKVCEQRDMAAKETADQVSHQIAKRAEGGAKQWVDRSLKVLDMHMTELEKRDPAEISVTAWDKLTLTMDRIIKLGRLTHGLDAEANARPLVAVNASILICQSPQNSATIEVETKQTQTPVLISETSETVTPSQSDS